jgi:predicted MPP superfamily phosphohydrolase
MWNVVWVFLILSLIGSLEIYVSRYLTILIKNRSLSKKLLFLHWFFSAWSVLAVLLFVTLLTDISFRVLRSFVFSAIFTMLLSKLFAAFFLLIRDIDQWLKPKHKPKSQGSMSRSEFLMKTGAVVAAMPIAGTSFGILSGAHDYRLRKQKLAIANLPREFEGLTLGHISDIHSGSFFNKRAVKGGVSMLLAEKPDLVFFTGDLVNERTDELKGYFDIFGLIKADLGVYSVLGNHDYGTYYRNWQSEAAFNRNFADMLEAHRLLGWQLLRNENRSLELGREKLAILGVENWGKGRFPKWGDIIKANLDTQDCKTKLLLSHDPSHWDLQVRPLAPDVDVTFSGHTHGMQLGVEIPGFVKFSPVQFVYEQWAGLYCKDQQQLYVNRGFGYIGFPGRLGIPPEIAVFELVKA